MGVESSVDRREQRLIESERLIARLRAQQLEDLAVLDRVQVATGDGSKNLSEWTSARLDVSLDTARTLVRTMRRTEERSDLREALAEGEVTFDRVEVLSRLPETDSNLDHLDISAVRREAAKQARITSETEPKTAADNILVMQPSLDESWWKVWGGLDGYSGALVDKVLTEAADDLPDLPEDERASSSWRRATALVGLCVSEEPAPAQVTLFVDADHAAETNGQAGVMLEAGPKVGQQALEAILCDAVTEITVNPEDGIPMAYGRKTRTVPPALRRAVLATHHGYCTVPGCDSRYRVEVHHKTPWSQGGTTDPDNLVALCWYHHHIVVHERGFTVTTDPTTGQTRLVRPPPRAGPD